MAINQVIIDGETKIDLTEDTVDENSVLLGRSFHSADGTIKTGVVPTRKIIDTDKAHFDDIVSKADDGDFFVVQDYSRNPALFEKINNKAEQIGGGSDGILPKLHIVSEHGSTVSVTNGSITLNPTETSGVWECDVPTYGNWTIHSVNESGDAIATIYVDTVKIYNIDDSHFSATINVTYPDGATCSVKKGDQTYYATSNPYAFSVHSTGAWIVSATKDGTTESKTVNIISDGQSATVEILMASIKVTVADDFMGEVLNLTNGSDTKTWVIDGSDKTFAVSFGTWVATIEKGGKTYSSSEVEVSAYTLYELNVASYGFEGWLDAGRVTQTYASLDDVLADEKTLRQLFTIHNSVDYLVEWIESDNAIGQTILSNDYVAKWVNLRDYALDKLYDSNSCKAIMDSVDKYGYGEWVNNNGTWQPKGNVPVMTANNAPYGEVISSGYINESYGTDGWKPHHAFDRTYPPTTNDGWVSKDISSPQYIGYKFANPIKIKKVHWVNRGGASDANGRIKTYRIEVSQDGINWINLTNFITRPSTDNAEHKPCDTLVNSDDYYLYSRVYITEAFLSFAGCCNLQFYGRELSVSVPKMTSNTEPFGEVKSSGNYSSSYQTWYGFADGKASEGWMPNSTNGWIQYDFGKPVVAKFVREASMKNGSLIDTNRASSMTVQGSNDGVTFTDIIGNISVSGSKHSLLKSFENQNPYKIYRISVVRVGGTDTPWLGALNFYGLDYSEKEFANDGSKWIYDHGVELEEMEIAHWSGFPDETSIKKSDCLYMSKDSTTQKGASGFRTINAINLYDYDLARVRLGKELKMLDTNSKTFGTISVVNPSDGSTVAYSQITSETLDNSVVNISSFNDLNRIYVSSVTGGTLTLRMTITEIWLE